MSLDEGTATVVRLVFARLIRDGTIPREMFENIATAQDRMANETMLEDKRESARSGALAARLILEMADGGFTAPPVTAPNLRVVRPDDTHD